LLAMGALALFLRKWQPKRIFLLNGQAPTVRKYPVKEVILSWSPFYLLTGFVLIWSLPVFKSLFQPGNLLSPFVFTFNAPGTPIVLSI
ncbi:L-lactate permease, partial [Escherichia coli]|nr:L-lactate permease [Escherichia coli]